MTQCVIGGIIFRAALYAGFLFAVAPAYSQVPDVVVLDFAHPAGAAQHIGSGMLSSISRNQPEDRYIAPLHFSSWRLDGNRYGQYGGTAFDLYDRVHSLGVQDIFYVLGPINLPVDEDRARWFARRDEALRETIITAQRLHEQFVWDVWNEPNLKIGGAKDSIFKNYDDWYEVWDRTVRTIRSVDPNAQIMGPSYSGLDLDHLHQFIEHCAQSHTMPQVIDWHAGEIVDYPDAAKNIKQWAVALGYTVSVAVGEAIGAGTDRNLDAGLPSFLFGIAEREQIRTVHATWSFIAMAGEPQSTAAELAGLVTRETKEPRGVWWTYKAYGDMTGNMIAVQASPNGRVDGVGSVDAEKKTATILLGTKAVVGGAVELRLTGLASTPFLVSSAKTVHVNISRISSTEVALPAPIPVEDEDVRLDAQGDLDLAAFVGNRQSIVIQLTPGGTSASTENPQKSPDQLRLPFSDSLRNANTSPTSVVFEGEEMAATSNSKITKVAQRNSSGLAYSLAAFQASGDIASYQFKMDHAGRYLLWVRYTQDPDGGIIQAAINGKDVFGPIDTYSESNGLHEVPCGVVQLGAGLQTISFRVAGRNVKSRGYVFGLDAIRLAAVGESTKFEMRKAASHFSVTSTGQLLQYEIPALSPGKYNIAVTYRLGPSMGKFALLLDGLPVGRAHDAHSEYSDEVTFLDERSNFDTAFVSGNKPHTLSFLALGKSVSNMQSAVQVESVMFTRYKQVEESNQ